MCFDDLKEGGGGALVPDIVGIELTPRERRQVFVRAKAVCGYAGIEDSVINGAFEVPHFLIKLRDGQVSFSGTDLKKLADVLEITPSFLLESGKPSEDEMYQAYKEYEGGQNVCKEEVCKK